MNDPFFTGTFDIMTSDAVVRILVVHTTQSDAEPLITPLRHRGQPIHAHFVASEAELESVVHNSHWDLFYLKLDTDTIDSHHCIQLVQRSGKDIPIIGLLNALDSHTESIAQIMQMGVRDVIAQNNADILVLTTLRELDSLYTRRKYRSTKLALRESERRCQLLLDSSVDAISYVHEGMHIYSNGAYLKLFGYDDIDELRSMPLMDLIAKQDLDAFKRILKADTTTQEQALQCQVIHESGEAFGVCMRLSQAIYDGETCLQITIRKADADDEALKAKIAEMSSRDLLTGAFNRQYFYQLIEEAYQKAVKEQRMSSLLYLQIDAFADLKADNGLMATDRLLVDMVDLLTCIVTPSPIGRLSDDVCVILLQDITVKQTLAMAHEIQNRLLEHVFDIDGRNIEFKLNCGVVTVDETLDNSHESLHYAHNAATLAANENERIYYYDRSKLLNQVADSDIASKLRYALEHSGFELLFQPIVSLRGDTQENYEALLRLHDDGKDISPDDFLSAASIAGLCTKLDRWVVLNVAKKLAQHQQQQPDSTARIFVHITTESLQDPSFLPWVNSVFKATKLSGDRFVFQLRETDVRTYIKAAKTFSKALQVLHCRFALTHFGALDNSMKLIRQHLVINFIKLHSSFIVKINEKGGLEQLKNKLADIHEADICAIVPNIESASTLSMLWQTGVNYIQGYYLREPSTKMDYEFGDDN